MTLGWKYEGWCLNVPVLATSDRKKCDGTGISGRLVRWIGGRIGENRGAEQEARLQAESPPRLVGHRVDDVVDAFADS
jgi:hypothetical protein